MLQSTPGDMNLRQWQLPGRIWRVVPGPREAGLGLMIIPPGATVMDIQYAWVSPAGELHGPHKPPGASWRMLRSCRPEGLLLQGFLEEGMPNLQGLALMEPSDGRLIWELPDLSPLDEAETHLFEKQGDVLSRLDPLTGHYAGESTLSEARAESQAWSERRYGDLRLPEATEGPEGPEFELEAAGLRARARHSRGDKGIDLHLEIWEGETLRYEARLREGDKGMTAEPFTFWEGAFVFLMGDDNLCAFGPAQISPLSS